MRVVVPALTGWDQNAPWYVLPPRSLGEEVEEEEAAAGGERVDRRRAGGGGVVRAVAWHRQAAQLGGSEAGRFAFQAVSLKRLRAACPAWVPWPRLPRDGREWLAAAVVAGVVLVSIRQIAFALGVVLGCVLLVAVPVGGLVRWRARVGARRAAALRAAQLSYRIEELDAMSPTGFELAVRDLMIRDQIRARHVGQRGDQAADVKGTDAVGRVLVVQCKHTTTGGRVGARVMYEVNGTAKPVHGADVAIVITNGGFTRDARAFADQHGIRLIDRDGLIRWAAFGGALHTLLGLKTPATTHPAPQPASP